ncbi:MAG: hypothetical protein JSW47_10740 [Phycisphaerales bacterium]|nr:MAG: hypothetical protein JSW47_10740 [Phycisphaerales bacterium]
MTVNIHIERLILDGLSVPYHQQPLLQAAVETELEHLFIAGGTVDGLMTNSEVSCISGGSIKFTNADNKPTHLGEQIARAVYKGVSQ